jgi:hypothetical protein
VSEKSSHFFPRNPHLLVGVPDIGNCFPLAVGLFFPRNTYFSVTMVGFPFLSFMVAVKIPYSAARSPER